MRITSNEVHATSRTVARRSLLSAISFIALALAGWTMSVTEVTANEIGIQPRQESESLAAGDAFADVTFWANEDDPGASLIIASDNVEGVHVYAVDGRLLDSEPLGVFKRVAVLGIAGAGAEQRLLVGAINARRNQVVVVSVDPSTGRIEPSLAALERLESEPTAFCAASMVGRTSESFVALSNGDFARFQITSPWFQDEVTVRRVASVDVGPDVVDCVADRLRRSVWLAQRDSGIWKFRLHLDSSSRPSLVAASEDLETAPEIAGLALARPAGNSFLLASTRPGEVFVMLGLGDADAHGGRLRSGGGSGVRGRFRVVAGNDIDEVTGSHGIDAAALTGIPGLPGGLAAVIDETDQPGGGQNLKFIALDDIVEALERP